MKLSTWLTIAAVVAVVFGLAFVLVTGPLLSFYGITLDKAGTLVAQLFGAALIGFAVLNWFARGVTDREARQAIVLANLASDTVGFVMALIGQLAGVANALGWSTVALYLLLALGFAYFQFMKPSTA
ncbi:MAG: hypothetical protein A2W37_11280 [Chloroflexi bacterium RBG_16_63_12]|nr:MAG: hypothetical protein A2W37_11280 [Chloroflexi bacterium RBG_16_63_12]